ncbi:hypothetical protein LCGC14_1376420 [marine sediment metagenome]|uniref:Uncharacterized protein n=1 Tax=marine sediment metagenome TaxID=412755 RepID=A0A0F9K409_9ZZZZ
MKELDFKINKYLMLKLEQGTTNIYVNNKLFWQCNYDDTEFIDEFTVRLNKVIEFPSVDYIIIPYESEFREHCLNLQTWVDNNYNTRLLPRHLVFPLLEKLAEIGDPQAKLALKEEIINRFLDGDISIRKYLVCCCYFDYLTKDEFIRVLDDFLQLLKVRYKKENKGMEVEFNKEIYTSNKYGYPYPFDRRYDQLWFKLTAKHRRRKELNNLINGFMKTYLIDPNEIDLIKRIFTWYIEIGEYQVVDFFYRHKKLFLTINKNAIKDYKRYLKIEKNENKYRNLKRSGQEISKVI